jgi:GT2 family glycosyltransferase
MSQIISVVIPVHNRVDYLVKCIESIENSEYKSYEIIIVDDASTFAIKELLNNGIKYYRLDSQSGPAAARNYGAANAKGKILLFLDSDITVNVDTLGRIVEVFETKPEIAAVFGSYDSQPFEPDFLSQYKNLVHHFVHQNGNKNASTFWAGCGAIKKEVFSKIGGFDEEKFKTSSIEDIELGYRLKNNGYKILLDKTLQVKHLKKWSIKNYLSAEIFRRAVPWSRLIVETGNFHSDLNLKISDRISALLIWFILLITTLLIIDLLIIEINLIFIELSLLFFVSILLLFLNYKFYTFLLVNRGFLFLIKSIPIHFLYFFYSSSVFVLVWLKHKLKI